MLVITTFKFKLWIEFILWLEFNYLQIVECGETPHTCISRGDTRGGLGGKRRGVGWGDGRGVCSYKLLIRFVQVFFGGLALVSGLNTVSHELPKAPHSSPSYAPGPPHLGSTYAPAPHHLGPTYTPGSHHLEPSYGPSGPLSSYTSHEYKDEVN